MTAIITEAAKAILVFVMKDGEEMIAQSSTK